MTGPASFELADCVLVADDLTGACDSAVQFATRGIRSVVYLDIEAAAHRSDPVKTFSTDTRDANETTISARIQEVAQVVSASHPRLLFKKIDSLMRGNPGVEIAAAMDAFACDVAIITPAFPDMGRTVQDGYLEVIGNHAWEPLRITERLREQGLDKCIHLAPGALRRAIRDGERHLSVEITSNEDLDQLVTEALEADRRVLWAGSGGLAAALARVLFPGTPRYQAPERNALPVLFCIGSDHCVTTAQIALLESEERVAAFDPAVAAPQDIETALEEGSHVLLRITRMDFLADGLKPLLGGIRGRASAIVLSGGDTASAVCRALAVQEIEVIDQIVTGLPWGRLRGGPLDGFPVATKSGAFGREDALKRVTDFFTCRKT